jgi:hypothetical protein
VSAGGHDFDDVASGIETLHWQAQARGRLECGGDTQCLPRADATENAAGVVAEEAVRADFVSVEAALLCDGGEPVELDLSPDEKKEYLALRRICEQQFSKRMRQEETPAQLRVAIFAAMTRLRQIACSETKITHVVELAKELAAEGNRALVFSQFTSFLSRVRDALSSAGLRVGYLAGDTPTAKRRAIVDAFQRGEYDVFCVSLLAGGPRRPPTGSGPVAPLHVRDPAHIRGPLAHHRLGPQPRFPSVTLLAVLDRLARRSVESM